MPSPSSRARADARRRARLVARGELPAEEEAVDEAPEPQTGGLLGRLFPSAPPLPGRPDPLAGFDESGSLRPLRVRAFLLRRNLLAWVVPGLVAFLGYSVTLTFGPESFVSLLGTFVQFGSLIGAGWFGWQRPTLYGTAAGILSYAFVIAFGLFATAQLGASPEAFAPAGTILVRLAVETLFLASLGFLAGWYGGYLRRRQAQIGGVARRR